MKYIYFYQFPNEAISIVLLKYFYKMKSAAWSALRRTLQVVEICK